MKQLFYDKNYRAVWIKKRIRILGLKNIRRFFMFLKQAFESKKTFNSHILRPLRHFFGIGLIKLWDKDLDIIFENKDFVVLNKPAKMLTHPTKKNELETLLNALLFHLYKSKNLVKNYFKNHKLPGPISRLDRDTSGCVLFAISNKGRSELGKRMMKHGFTKKYQCLVKGKILESAEITTALMRDESHATRMKIAEDSELGAKSAHTIYEPIQYFETEDVSLVSVQILTGRMHQIRVHMQSIGHPIVGDILYGDKKLNQMFLEKYKLNRQFLHACSLSWEEFNFDVELSEELQQVLDSL